MNGCIVRSELILSSVLYRTGEKTWIFSSKKKRIVKEKVVKENYVVGGGVGWLAVITYMFTDVRMRDNKKSSMHPWSALWIINKDNQSI